MLACFKSWFLTPLNIPRVCLNLTVEKSKKGTQSKLHCIEDNQEHVSYAGGLTIDLSEQSVFSDLSAIFLVLCNVTCKRVKGWIFMEKTCHKLCMHEEQTWSSHLGVPKWCTKLLSFIIGFMEVSVLAIISPCTLEDWSCWMLGWYCIIIFVHFVPGFELGFYCFGSMCPSGWICKFDQILDLIPVMILKPEVGFLACRIMLFYKLL